MALVKVDGQPGFARNTITGAIVNTNSTAIAAARERKNRLKDQLKRSEELEQEVKTLKNDINEIKNLLMRMVDGNNNG